MANESKDVTLAHIERVRELIAGFTFTMESRGFAHDQSKFEPVEMEPLDEMQRLIAKEGHAPYGSDEYKRRSEMLKPMLEHHYANNSHHPEHYENGIAGMDLADLVEMLMDWKAASERGEESTLNLTHSIERFKIEPQLASILKNTAERLGWKIS